MSYWFIQFSQKRTGKLVALAGGRNFSFVFFVNLKTTKGHFEINWPLVSTKFENMKKNLVLWKSFLSCKSISLRHTCHENIPTNDSLKKLKKKVLEKGCPFRICFNTFCLLEVSTKQWCITCKLLCFYNWLCFCKSPW